MSKTALLFPGQGSQSVGMGSTLCASFPRARARFDEASGILGFDLLRVCSEGPEEELRKTHTTQPAAARVIVGASTRVAVVETGARTIHAAWRAEHTTPAIASQTNEWWIARKNSGGASVRLSLASVMRCGLGRIGVPHSGQRSGVARRS